MRVVLLLSALLLWGSLEQVRAADDLNQPNLSFLDYGTLSANGGQVSIVNFKIKNTGFTTSTSCHVGYYLSLDENISTTDILLGDDFVSGLAPSGTSIQSFSFNVDDYNLPNGTYYFGAIIDYKSKVNEYDEQDNKHAWSTPKIVVGGKPNLFCKGVGELEVNDLKIDIGWAKIANNGTAPAGASKTGFYLSTDRNFNTNDIFLGSVNVPALQPDEFVMMDRFVIDLETLNLPAGEYFIGYIIDYLDNVKESNETDNAGCSFDHKIVIESSLPNLLCGQLGDLNFSENLMKLTITGAKVRNNGGAASQKMRVVVVLSADNVFTTSDIIIANRFINPIQPGNFADLGEIVVDLNSYNLNFGTYSVGLIIDFSGQVLESNEGDNTCGWSTSPIVVGGEPNLICKQRGNLSAVGSSIRIKDIRVQNTGDDTANASKIGFYLSTNSTISTSDIFIGSLNTPALVAGATGLLPDFTANIGSLDITPGEYFIGFIVDYQNAVAESNENDNAGCKFDRKIVIQPKLPNLLCGELGALNFNPDLMRLTIGRSKIRNNGHVASSKARVVVVLSKDGVFNSADLAIGVKFINPVPAGGSIDLEAFDIDLSSYNLDFGTYQVGIIIDFNGQVTESNEFDNTCGWPTSPILVGGDPNLKCISAGNLSVFGTDVTITGGKIRNVGDGEANSSKVGFYLSTNSTISTSDIFLGSRTISALAAGATANVPNFSIDLDALNLAVGEYFIGYIADFDNAVAESNENDNAGCSFDTKITIVQKLPNLLCGELGDLFYNPTLNKISITGTKVKNNGHVASAKARVAVVLSTDDIIDNNDIAVAVRFINPIQPGQSLDVGDFDIDLSAYNLAFDTYKVGIIIDFSGQVAESNEHDNTCFWATSPITMNGDPDLACEWRGEIILQNGLDLYVSWTTIVNQGDAKADSSVIGFYLSTDTIFTTDDYLFGTQQVGELEPGEKFVMSEELLTDLRHTGLPSGFYYVGLIIDYQNEVAESNEENNNDCYWDNPRIFIPKKKANLTCEDRGRLTIDDNMILTINGSSFINTGGKQSESNVAKYYISQDAIFGNAGDILIAQRAIEPLNPGQSQTINQLVTANLENLDIETGIYFIGIVVDADNQVDESNESDNASCFWEQNIIMPLPADPNLFCIDAGKIVIDEHRFTVTDFTIGNNGEQPTGSSSVGVYLSTNQFISTSDILVRTINVGSIPADGVASFDFSVNVDGLNLTEGQYFIGFVLDKDDQVIEGNEDDNNTCVFNQKITIKEREPNLICINGGSGSQGSSVQFAGIRVKNDGDAASSASRVAFYLSSDNNVTTGDIFLGKVNIPALNPEQTFNVPTFTVNSTTLDVADGEYFISFFIDDQNVVKESNENDNNSCAFVRKIVVNNHFPNLKCLSAGNINVDGTRITIQNVRVMNGGSDVSGTSKIGFYLSSNSTFSTSDIFIGVRNIPALGIGQSTTISSLVVDVEGLNLAPGTYFIGAIVDFENAVEEENEADNNSCFVAGKKIIIPEPKPNLTCKDEGHITVNGYNIQTTGVRIQNIGPGPSAATNVKFYLSANSTISTSDIPLASLPLKALSSGEFTTLQTLNVNVGNLNVQPGTYFVGYIVDPDNTVAETNESDNNGCRYATTVQMLPKKPNLTCLDRGEAVGSGSTITISWVRVKNNGEASTPVSKVGYYLSSNTNFTDEDILIGTGTIPALAPNGTATLNPVTINLSGLGLPVGEYFIGLILDYDKKVDESNENDNNDCFFTQPKVVVHPPKPNLTCKDAGEIQVNGTKITSSWARVMNSGGSNSGGFSVGYYLSTDTHFTTGDTKIGEVHVNSLAPNQVTTLPTFHKDVESLNLTPGTYYFGFIIDFKNDVAESNETDNNDCFFQFSTISILPGKPDLACKDLGEIQVTDSKITVSWAKVMNSGESTSGATRVGFYLSTNTTISPSNDFFIGSRQIPALGSGQVATIPSTDLNITGIPAGTYFLGYFIDDQNKVHESDEHNNTCFWSTRTIVIQPSKPNLTYAGGGYLNTSGSVINLSNIRIINNGGSSAGASKVAYYLSTDQNITTSDIFIGDDHVSALAVNQISTESASINISNLNIAGGQYYVGFIIDYQGQVMESNEHDNVFRFQTRLQITNNTGKPDLICESTGTLDLVGTDKYRVSGLKVKNGGNKAAAASKIGFYLSTDPYLSVNTDYLVEIKQVSSLNPGAVQTLNFTDNIPQVNVPAGTYYLLYVLDYDNSINESNESNNVCYLNVRRIVVPDGTSNNACACTNYSSNYFCEDFESYSLGKLNNATTCFTTYTGQGGNYMDGTIETNNNTKYLKIKGTNTDENQDLYLRLGNRQTGAYEMEYKMFLFPHDRGFYSMMHVFRPLYGSNQAAFNVHFGGLGKGYVEAGGNNLGFDYPMNSWFTVKHQFDLDLELVSLVVNGVTVAKWRFSGTSTSSAFASKQLAAVNFKPLFTNHAYYIDDIKFEKVQNIDWGGVESRGNEALSNVTMSYYPNPAKELLTVEMEAPEAVDMTVELYNTMGQLVRTIKRTNVTAITETIDLEGEPAGVYYIKGHAGDHQLTRSVVVIE